MEKTTGDGGIGEWLRLAMAARRMSNRRLGELSGVDHSTISRIVHGQRSPAWSTVARLSAALGVAPVDAADASPTTRVLMALLADPELATGERDRIVAIYLRARMRIVPSAATRTRRVDSLEPGVEDPPMLRSG